MQREQQRCKDCVHHKVCKFEESFTEMIDRPTEADMPSCFSVRFYCDNYKPEEPCTVKDAVASRGMING